MPSGNPGTEGHLPGRRALKCGALRRLLPESPGPEAVPPGPPHTHTHTMATLLLSYPHCSVWAKCMYTGYSLMARPGMPAAVSGGHNPRPALFHSPQYRPLAPIFIVARLVSEPVRGLCIIKRHPVSAVSFDTKSGWDPIRHLPSRAEGLEAKSGLGPSHQRCSGVGSGGPL